MRAVTDVRRRKSHIVWRNNPHNSSCYSADTGRCGTHRAPHLNSFGIDFDKDGNMFADGRVMMPAETGAK